MSHSVDVKIIADQEIQVLGKTINIHDITMIEFSPDGRIIRVLIQCERCGNTRTLSSCNTVTVNHD